jgi:peptidoglycan/xylan/chitin deacetylase (PgdA/CDA1 family)
MIYRNLKRTSTLMACAAAGLVLMLSAVSPIFAHAATPTTLPASSKAKISFTFDDSLASTYTNAMPTLAEYGLTGTDYAISGCVGMTTVPNTCRANTDTPYMSWAQLEALQNTYGWEIGSHTVDHDCLASSAAQDPSEERLGC